MAHRTRLSLLVRTGLTAVVGTAVFAFSTAVGGILGALLFAAVALVIQVGLTAAVFIPAVVIVGSPLMTALRELPGGWLELYAVFAAAGFVYGAVLAARLGHRTVHEQYRTLDRGTTADQTSARLQRTVDGLARQASTTPPTVRVVDVAAPLTYTLPVDDGAAIVVSRGTVSALDDDELRAVLAHEVAHVANGDLRTMPAVMLPLSTARQVREKSYGARPWGMLFWATMPAVSWLSRVAVGLFSRGRELAADDGAAAITGQPAALASALRTIHAADSPSSDLREQAWALSVLRVAGDTDGTDADGGLLGLTASHPPLERRVERLQRRAHELASDAESPA